MPLPNDSIKSNECIQNVKVRNKRKINSKIDPLEYKVIASLSLLSDEEEEDQRKEFATKSQNEKLIVKPFALPSNSTVIPTPIKISLISEDEDEEDKEINIATTSKLGDKSDESKISGTDFDLITRQSEMKGLKPTSTNRKNDLHHDIESYIYDKQIEIIEPVTDDIHELNEPGSIDFDAISSVTEDEMSGFIRHNSPMLLNLENPDELPRAISYTVQGGVIEQNGTEDEMSGFIRHNSPMLLNLENPDELPRAISYTVQGGVIEQNGTEDEMSGFIRHNSPMLLNLENPDELPRAISYTVQGGVIEQNGTEDEMSGFIRHNSPMLLNLENPDELPRAISYTVQGGVIEQNGTEDEMSGFIRHNSPMLLNLENPDELPRAISYTVQGGVIEQNGTEDEMSGFIRHNSPMLLNLENPDELPRAISYTVQGGVIEQNGTEDEMSGFIRHNSPMLLNLENPDELPRAISYTVQGGVIEQNGTEDEMSGFIRHNSPMLLNLQNPDELPRAISYAVQGGVIEQSGTIKLFVSNNNNMYSLEKNRNIVNENLEIIDEINNPIPHNQYEIRSNEFHSLIKSDVAEDTLDIKEIEKHAQDEWPEVNVSNLTDKGLNLSMKTPELLPNNISGIPESNKLSGNDNIVDEDDDDPFKLVIVDNDEIETDYQMDADLVTIRDEPKSSNEHIPAQFQSLQNYSRNKNHSSQNELYMDNIDDNAKSPTINNRVIVKSAAKRSINKPSNNDKPKQFDYEVASTIVKHKKRKTMVQPELQCSEEKKVKNPLLFFAEILQQLPVVQCVYWRIAYQPQTDSHLATTLSPTIGAVYQLIVYP
ncbi:uncharacterized protein LOC111040142 [Myzus persicae]|uniref:uncharacterized protein LOC111040142 n=1 Tax=Myzus persicae TaxID=13164 RepID=UPI000B931D7D|nr:uncharacterized protein LOC111040142 [Myzus persicae]